MSDTFTGRRSAKIWENERGGIHYEHYRVGSNLIEIEVVQGLKQFFQNERDRQLGRWRWPDKPDYVVYPSELYLTPPSADLVTVFNERTGQSAHCRREDDGNSGHFSLAARAYFAAHPEPKPWHDAKPGEVWALIVDGVEKAFTLHGDLYRTGNLHDIEQTDGHITSGRRIWPEVPSE